MSATVEPVYWEAALSMLGGAFLDPRVIPDCARLVGPGDMPTQTTAVVWATLIELHQDDVQVDTISVAQRLEARGALQPVPSRRQEHDIRAPNPQDPLTIELLLGLSSAAATAVTSYRHAQVVRQYAVRRKVVAITWKAASDGGKTDLEEVRALAETTAGELLAAVSEPEKTRRKSLASVLRETLEFAEQRKEAGGALMGPTTGYWLLDKLTLGWNPANLYVLGGKTGKGKTALALNFMSNAARAKTHHVMIASLEMASLALGQRLFASEAMIDGQAIRSGMLTDGDLDRMVAANRRLYDLNAYVSVIDEPGLLVETLTAEALAYVRERQRALESRAAWERAHAEAHRRWEANGRQGREPVLELPSDLATPPPPLGLVIVDYLQLLEIKGKHRSREEQVSKISKGLLNLSRICGCAVLALSQLNDDGRTRESKAIEHDATGLLFLEFPEDDDGTSKSVGCKVRFSKHRVGPVGVAELVFQREHQRFAERGDRWGG